MTESVMRNAMCLATLLGVYMATTATAQNQCGPLTDVIRVGVNEMEISRTVSEARDLHNWACSDESRVTERTTSTAINARWAGFGSGAKRASASLEAYRQQNCHLSQETVTNDVASSFRQRTIDPGVLEAWRDCQTFQGVAITPTSLLGQTQINFTVRSTRLPLATLGGIRSRHFTCAAGGDEITPSGIGGEPVAVPGDVALNVYCERGSVEQEIGGRRVTVYPGTFLSLDLSTGSHNMEFAERRVGTAAEEWADLRERVDDMSAEMATLDARIEELGPIFGNWVEVAEGQTYRAESDGMLMALPRGRGCTDMLFDLVTGETEPAMRRRSGGGRCLGASIPVKEGHYYRIDIFQGSSYMEGWWLPARR